MRIHSGEKPFTCPDWVPLTVLGSSDCAARTGVIFPANTIRYLLVTTASRQLRQNQLHQRNGGILCVLHQSSTDDVSNTAPTEADHPLAKGRKAPEMDDMSSVIGYTRDGRPITVGASYLMGFTATAKLSE